MHPEGRPIKEAVYSALHETPTSKTLCVIVLSPRAEGEPGLVIHAPGQAVAAGLYELDLPTVLCTIYVEDVRGSSYSDYINAIALCMMRAGLTRNIIVAAEAGGDGMLYCSHNDSVYSSWIRSKNISERIACLKDMCLDTFHRIQQELVAPGEP